MFLFFTFYQYDASGGANDLIGKAIGDTWADLTTLLDANIEADEADGDFPRSTSLLEYIQVLDLETLEKRTAHIEASRNTDGMWVVEDFWFYNDEKTFLDGIPFVIPSPAPKPVPPPPPSPADYVYYKIGAVALFRLFEGGKVAEQKRFQFMVKRPKDRPFVERQGEPNESVIDMAMKTFLHQHGERLNQTYGRMTWHVQIPNYSCKLWDEYSPSLGDFLLFPENGDEALQKSNPTYEEFDVQGNKDDS